MGRGKKRVPYHQAFCAATELELKEDKGQLSYYREHIVNVDPRQVDLLIVKSDGGKLHSGLGEIFKKYNLFEYKSPDQRLGIEQYHKALAYVILLVERQKRREECSIDDFTLSFVRKRMPKKLFGQLRELGFRIVQYQPGIYHVTRMLHVDMQFVITSRLGKEYQWITMLTNQLERRELERLCRSAEDLTDPEDRSNAEAVLDLAMLLNKKCMKEESAMGYIRDLLKDEFEEKDHQIAELSEQLQSKEEQLKNQNSQLQSQEEQLKNQSSQLQSQTAQLRNKDKQIVQLKEELARLQKLFGDQIAML